jgi:uncharacterized protein (TIGR02300 family)
MDKVDKGKKHNCLACYCKFYDFNKDIAICPKCGTEQVLEKEVIQNIENKENANSQEGISEDNSLEEEVHFDNEDKNIATEGEEDI